MRRVVFDCMIFLQAIARSTGPAAALLELVENGTLKLLLSVEILDEVAGVLRRPELTTKFRSLTPQVETKIYWHSGSPIIRSEKRSE